MGTVESKVTHEGERILGNEQGTSLLREHEDRYQFALRYLTGRENVLDCACGSGYGARILSRRAARVTGMDLSPVAIEYAKRFNGSANTHYTEGSVYELPFPTSSLDLYCSFETIEHVDLPSKLIEEACRVLKPGGRFLCSTPNRILTRVGPGEKPPHNPFHLFELSLSEFDGLLRHSFSTVTHYGQRIKSRTKIELPYLASKIKRYTRQEDIIAMNVDPKRLDRFDSLTHWQPVTFVAVCIKRGDDRGARTASCPLRDFKPTKIYSRGCHSTAATHPVFS